MRVVEMLLDAGYTPPVIDGALVVQGQDAMPQNYDPIAERLPCLQLDGGNR